MHPIELGLAGLSALFRLGGLFGTKKNQPIDPAVLQRMFGANAVNKQLMDLFNRAINSTQGQALMTSAARQGQQFQTDLARGGAAAGFGGGGGADSGSSIFANAAGQGATNDLQRNMQASMMQSMMPIAQQMVSDQMGAYMQSYMGAQANPVLPTKGSEISNAIAAGLGQAAPMFGGGSNSGPPSAAQLVAASDYIPGPSMQLRGTGTNAASTATAPASPAMPATTNTAAPTSMNITPDLTPQVDSGRNMGSMLSSTRGGSRFNRKIGRFQGAMGGAVQPMMAMS